MLYVRGHPLDYNDWIPDFIGNFQFLVTLYLSLLLYSENILRTYQKERWFNAYK